MSNHLGTGTNTTFARGEHRCTRLRGHQLQPIHQRVLPHAHYVLLLLSCCFLKFMESCLGTNYYCTGACCVLVRPIINVQIFKKKPE